MQKRLIVVFITVVILAAVGTGLWVTSKKTLAPTTKEVSLETPSPTAPRVLTWEDPMGFTFTYPEGVVVNKHDEDNENYAHVELTSKDHPGNLIVWAKDTTASDVTAWVRTEKQFEGATTLDTTLSNQPAKKIVLLPNKLIVGTIFDELLFTIDATLDDKAYWSQVQATIVNSFTFKPAQASSGGDVSGDQAVDEEEVVQ